MNTKTLAQFIVILIVAVLISAKLSAQNYERENKIKLTKFIISADKERISIDWATDNAVPTNYFEIQKSLDGVNFKTIALVLGADPKKSTCDCYGCFDKYEKTVAHLYYRLKHIDSTGAEEISETKSFATL